MILTLEREIWEYKFKYYVKKVDCGYTYINYTNISKIKQNYGKLRQMTIQITNVKNFFIHWEFLQYQLIYIFKNITEVYPNKISRNDRSAKSLRFVTYVSLQWQLVTYCYNQRWEKYALFYYMNMLLIYQNMLLFSEKSKICTCMPKISKKEHIYSISGYNIVCLSWFLIIIIVYCQTSITDVLGLRLPLFLTFQKKFIILTNMQNLTL